MNLHTYESSSGKDLIMEYILGLPEMERIDALSVLKSMEDDELDTLEMIFIFYMPVENRRIKLKKGIRGVYMPFTGLDVNAVIEREKLIILSLRGCGMRAAQNINCSAS